MPKNTFEIRSLHLIDELEDARRLESKIWGNSDSIPTHQTLTAVKNGGLVLGAYDGERLIGFQYSFPGFKEGRVYLCSHILAADPEYRNQGIGEKLKLAQRDEARKLGYPLITWTYDPLESVNGYLNIHKLGGICSTYIENCYGEMDDLLNNGIASDRLLVEWHINREKQSVIESDIALAKETAMIQWTVDQRGLPIPSSALSASQQDCIFVPVPKNFRSIKETDFDAAIEWRMLTRKVFNQCFKQGWQVDGFLKHNEPDIPVHFYVLTKKQILPEEKK